MRPTPFRLRPLPPNTPPSSPSPPPPNTGIPRLLSLAIPHRRYLYLGCTVLLLRLPFSLSIPHFVAATISSLADSATGPDFTTAKTNIIYLAVCGTIDAVLDFWCVYLFGLCQLNLVKTVRTTLFKRIINMEVSFFDKTSSGTLTSRLNSDTTEMANDLT